MIHLKYLEREKDRETAISSCPDAHLLDLENEENRLVWPKCSPPKDREI